MDKHSSPRTETLPATTVPDKTVRDVLEQFLIGEPAKFEDQLAALTSSADALLHDAAMTFQSNLRSVVMVGSLPFKMTQGAVINRRYGQIQAAEHIRALKPPGEEPEAEHLAYERAKKKFDDEMRTPRFIGWSRDQIVLELADLLKDEAFTVAAEELLRQSVVMIWGAFEVLVSDVVVQVVNKNPSLAAALLSNEATRKHFPTRGIVDVLAEHKFDVASVMGDVLFADLHFDRLPMMREVLGAIFGSSLELLRRIADEALWILWQRRHLIVHKRGVIDKSYLSKTGDTQPEGTMLKVGSDYVEKALNVVLDVGADLLKAGAGG